jgi:hypothetical protein
MTNKVSGVYVIKAMDSPMDRRVFSDPNVDGIVVRTTWQDTEPQKGKYQWGYIDGEISQAAASGKMVNLIVLPGAYTPDWAKQGVPTASFTSKYGFSAGEAFDLPMPWDSTYLERWHGFIRALRARYDPNSAVVLLPAVGPTSISAEMSLPDYPEDVEKWISLGYTKEKYEAAWQKTIDVYMQAFPHKKITLTLYPGLPIPNRAARDALRQDLVDYGVNRYPAQFNIQTSGLSGRKKMDPRLGYMLVKSYSSRITTGFTLSTAASVKPENMGSSDPLQALMGTVKYGLAAGVKYLVIWEKDILDPVTQPAVKYTHQQLAAR